MKTYIKPSMNVRNFNYEEIVITSSDPGQKNGLQVWQETNTAGQVVEKNLNEMTNILQITF
ncbi:MAG: hypothetical protein PUD92_05090 [Clostridiales bacterium]|nr:hypothetical protein [Clostridiales bacterium]